MREKSFKSFWQKVQAHEKLANDNIDAFYKGYQLLNQLLKDPMIARRRKFGLNSISFSPWLDLHFLQQINNVGTIRLRLSLRETKAQFKFQNIWGSTSHEIKYGLFLHLKSLHLKNQKRDHMQYYLFTVMSCNEGIYDLGLCYMSLVLDKINPGHSKTWSLGSKLSPIRISSAPDTRIYLTSVHKIINDAKSYVLILRPVHFKKKR